jgi:hypothetical protein
MAKLTVGRIVHAYSPSQPSETGYYGPKAAICTHTYPDSALLRVLYSTPEMDKVVKVSIHPEGRSDGETWRWSWPPRDQ